MGCKKPSTAPERSPGLRVSSKMADLLSVVGRGVTHFFQRVLGGSRPTTCSFFVRLMISTRLVFYDITATIL